MIFSQGNDKIAKKMLFLQDHQNLPGRAVPARVEFPGGRTTMSFCLMWGLSSGQAPQPVPILPYVEKNH